MSTAYHLRPVMEISPSPSPTASTTPPGDHSPQYKQPSALRPSPPPLVSANGRRRPLSPSSLRDVDLSHTPDMPLRKYPAPPTGHDLMAMFPPAPPDNFPEMRPGPTSGFFQRQERAFFAQAGKEIVRVRVEVDLPHGSEPEPAKPRPTNTSRTWPSNGPASSSASSAPHHSPVQSSSAPLLYPHPSSRTTQRGSASATAPLFQASSSHTSPSSQLPPNLHPPTLHQTSSGLRTPPQDPMQSGPPSSKAEYPTEEYDDEAWRRPMPYAERRRAGKHTRRVIVRT
ncbi:hypothetical protein B0H34DRAFT_677063 [Crassisporium funariophilum]|nr:hypothetical protein B0H34DRAFT_677063 [Crassisporium funariophilum]